MNARELKPALGNPYEEMRLKQKAEMATEFQYTPTPGVLVAGVGPDAPVEINEKGGKQSSSPYRSDLLPPLALLEVAKVTKHGVKYGEWNWHKIPSKDHLNHALTHIFAFQAGDTSEGETIEHARHAATRILFWLEMLVKEGEK